MTTKYEQVADELRGQITGGLLAPAAPLPSEAELMRTYGVSRPTARSALDLLRNEGLITVINGKGRFVRAADTRPRHQHDRSVVASSDGYGESGAATWESVEDMATYRTNATAEVALALGVAEHAPVFVSDRLSANGRGARRFSRIYVPFAVAAELPALEDNPFRDPFELYSILDTAGYHLTWSDSVRTRIPNPDDAATLKIPSGTPMLVIVRTTRDAETGRVLTVEDTRYSGESTELVYPVQATATPGNTT